MLNIAPATFTGAQATLEPELSPMLQGAMQPANEQLLLQMQTAAGEALIATTARVLILKSAANTTSGKATGRFFPWAGIDSFDGFAMFWRRSLTVVTSATRAETRPGNMAFCTFGVSFAASQPYHDALAYLRGALDTGRQIQKAAALNGPLTQITIPNIIPLSGERFFFSTDAVLFAEHTYRKWRGGIQGVSFRVVRGVYYRVGGTRGHSYNESVTEPDDRGTLALSDQRVLFIGKKRTIDVPLRSIASIQPFKDGLQVSIPNKAPILLHTGSDDAGLLLQRLCANPPP